MRVVALSVVIWAPQGVDQLGPERTAWRRSGSHQQDLMLRAGVFDEAEDPCRIVADMCIALHRQQRFLPAIGVGVVEAEPDFTRGVRPSSDGLISDATARNDLMVDGGAVRTRRTGGAQLAQVGAVEIYAPHTHSVARVIDEKRAVVDEQDMMKMVVCVDNGARLAGGAVDDGQRGAVPVVEVGLMVTVT